MIAAEKIRRVANSKIISTMLSWRGVDRSTVTFITFVVSMQ